MEVRWVFLIGEQYHVLHIEIFSGGWAKVAGLDSIKGKFFIAKTLALV